MIRPTARAALLAAALLVPASAAANPAGETPTAMSAAGDTPTAMNAAGDTPAARPAGDASPANHAGDAPPAADRVAEAPPAKQTRVYFGMWTSHTKDLQRGIDANSLLGASYRGIYGGTFVNSYGDRAYALGIQRSTRSSARAALKTALGYRVGLVTGYDERFLPIAAHLPAIPFAQLTGSVQHGRAGAELAFAGLTASLLVSMRL